MQNTLIKRFSRFFLALLLLGALFVVNTRFAHAETVVSGIYTGDTVWTAENSPYVINGYAEIPQGSSLTIRPGVRISGGSDFDTLSVSGGQLDILGTSDEKIYISSIHGIFLQNSDFDIANVDITGVGIFAEDSQGHITATTISGASDALRLNNSIVSVTASKFIDNDRAVTVEPTGLPVLLRGLDVSNIGGIGNALDEAMVSISNSALVRNRDYAIENLSDIPVMATDVWWGSSDGPTVGEDMPNSISGDIVYEPWLQAEPILEMPDQACCSSVLFLPGLEGSYMYKERNPFLGIGDGVNTLWPPNNSDDIRSLSLDTDGNSIDPSIYSGSPIGKVFGLFDVYGKFMDFLDNMVFEGKIGEWKSFGYDWRKPIDQVVAGPETSSYDGLPTATTTKYLVDEVEDLASRSKTGKVTMIAHSNGGLVAKYLVKTLTDMGKENLIDSVISVAVPYLGTPQAIAGILHGDNNQKLLSGIILKKRLVRELGKNMASAYSLLPSADYFTQAVKPSIAFASDADTSRLNDGSYPSEITSVASQDAFIVDANNVRSVPSEQDIKSPIKGNRLLVTAAEALHAIIDPFSWPTSIARWAIIGWNKDTTDGVIYDGKGYELSKTKLGDQTVVAESAAHDSGDIMSVDLATASDIEGDDVEHANILESDTTRRLIENAITKKEHDAVCDEVTKLPGVTCGLPPYDTVNVPKDIRISTHSPVELHIYDQNGNHTGVIPSPPEVEDDAMVFVEKKIRGSDIDVDWEDDDTETTVTVPDDGQRYDIVVEGTGVGAFTLEIDRVLEGYKVIDHVQYLDLPATPFMVASTSIQVPVGVGVVSTTTNILFFSRPLTIDLDGDGNVDITATSSANVTQDHHDPVEYINAIRDILHKVFGDNKRAKLLVKRLDRLEKLVAKDKDRRIVRSAIKLESKVSNIKQKKLPDANRAAILELVDKFILQFE